MRPASTRRYFLQRTPSLEIAPGSGDYITAQPECALITELAYFTHRYMCKREKRYARAAVLPLNRKHRFLSCYIFLSANVFTVAQDSVRKNQRRAPVYCNLKIDTIICYQSFVSTTVAISKYRFTLRLESVTG